MPRGVKLTIVGVLAFILVIVAGFVYRIQQPRVLTVSEMRANGLFLLDTPRELGDFALVTHRGEPFVPASLEGYVRAVYLFDGHDAERKAAAIARDREDLSWKHWARRVEKYLRHVEMLLSPDLIIAGGGASKHPDKWLPRIDIDTEIVPAGLANNAGIVGAAAHADQFRRRAEGLNAPPPPTS